HREVALIRADLREEDALEHQVADLEAQRRAIAGVDRVQHLVRFFEHEPAQRLEGLLAIPRAAFRPAQVRHDVDEPLKRGAGRRCGCRARLPAVWHEADYASIAKWKSRKSPASTSP